LSSGCPHLWTTIGAVARPFLLPEASGAAAGHALTRAKLAGGEQWLLVKKDDDGADQRGPGDRMSGVLDLLAASARAACALWRFVIRNSWSDWWFLT
jgi:hypothetical protein